VRDTLDVFRREFFKWAEAYNQWSKRQALGYHADAGELYESLRARISDEHLRSIGFALQDGWLATANDGRGYSICETQGKSRPQLAVFHRGGGKVIPWWELYVQLADFARLLGIANRRGLTVRMEDRERDITVWAGKRLLLVVENKETVAGAELLLRKMRKYGEEGFELDASDVGNDPLRKAKYLFRDDGCADYFGLSAVGYEKLFAVEYRAGNRFRLSEIPGQITLPLVDAVAEGVPPARLPSDVLAVELERVAAERNDIRIWLSPGTKQTAFNAYIYRAELGKHAIAAGVYQSGEIWSDFAACGSEFATRLALRLRELGVTVDPEKQYPHWRYDRSNIILNAENATSLAEALIDVIQEVDNSPR
jgi:hypothetical protein